MRLEKIVAVGGVFSSVALAQDATRYSDPITGLNFSSVTHKNGLIYRVALPANATKSDAVLQLIVPSSFSWCGFAWGGHMTNNPLSVSWATGAATGEKAIVSSRMAFGYYAIPAPYDGAAYATLDTQANTSHWQLTTRCQGCTIWSTSDGDFNLHNEQNGIFAYGCSSVPPDVPSRNDSNFNVHEQFGIWSHDLTIAKNENYYSKWSMD